jgi:hypothetical protein
MNDQTVFAILAVAAALVWIGVPERPGTVDHRIALASILGAAGFALAALIEMVLG